MGGVPTIAAVCVLVLIGSVPAAAQALGGAEPVAVPVGRMIGGLVLSVLAAFAAASVIKARRSGGVLATSDTRSLPLGTDARVLPGEGSLRQRLGFGSTARSEGRIRVVEARRISAQAETCLISSDGREYLVLITAGQPLLLREKEAVS